LIAKAAPPKFKYEPAKGAFKSWLLIKTRWKIVDPFRQRGPLGQTADPADADPFPDAVAAVPDPASPVPDEQWEKEWKENLFEAALAKVKLRLDPEKVQIFDFCAVKGWKAEKVAEKFRVKIADVYLIKHRITKAIITEIRRLEREAT
jgi:RNA polymerase sigma-70 factor (ECF subfamily)